jgi:hypothetical protein
MSTSATLKLSVSLLAASVIVVMMASPSSAQSYRQTAVFQTPIPSAISRAS